MSVTAAPLSVLDELFLHLDTPDEPWSVHMEIGVERRLDADRLTHAVHEALAWHPRARSRLATWRGSDAGYSWEFDETADHIPLAIVDCPDRPSLARARASLLSFSPRLDVSPPLALTLARGGSRAEGARDARDARRGRRGTSTHRG